MRAVGHIELPQFDEDDPAVDAGTIKNSISPIYWMAAVVRNCDVGKVGQRKGRRDLRGLWQGAKFVSLGLNKRVNFDDTVKNLLRS